MLQSIKTMQNPYLPLWEHLPDGEPRVFDDPDNPGRQRVYIIGSHDVRFNSYCGPDIRIWSAPVEDLSNWRDHGPVFTFQDPRHKWWDTMYAPDLVEVNRRNGKREYYLFPHSRAPWREAMVAKGDRPDGPFTPINVTPEGRLLEGSILGFDPSVYIEHIDDPADPDYETGFRAYGFWGFQKAHAAQLDPNTMYSLRPGTEVIHHYIPASASYGNIRDPQGTTYPAIFPDEDLTRFNYFEAFSIRKVGNKYVLVFSGYSGPDYGMESTNSTLRYMFGDTPMGPWRSGGVLVDSRGPVPTPDGTALRPASTNHNTHGGLELINGQWYAFYHRPPRGFGFARQAVVAPVIIDWDEKPVAEGGRVTIRGYDPFAIDNIWTAKGGAHEYTGAQITSEGFAIYGLDPFLYYSAGITSFLSNPETLQDAWDIWDNHQPITGVGNGHIVGFQHFGFGGLAKAEKGIPAFEGTRPGDNTKFNVFITPRTREAFSLQIWLNGAWDNEIWNGKPIGTIAIPANAPQAVTQYTLDVAQHVENLNQKNAIFVAAEGGDGPLFDFIGLGFSSDSRPLVRPVPPVINISVNGKPLDLPPHPIRATEQNGIVGYDKYMISVAGETDLEALTASADNPEVVATIEQGETPRVAVVTFDYKGVEKSYRIIKRPSWDLSLPSLYKTYEKYFLFGNILSPFDFKDDALMAMYRHHYNAATAENAMKPVSVTYAPGVYNFQQADEMVDYAQGHHIKMIGHTFVWHGQSAPWLNKKRDGKPLTRKEARQNMEAFIKEYATRYSGKIHSWDVINEVFRDDNAPFTGNWRDHLRHDSENRFAVSPWFLAYANGADEAAGENGGDYIFDAFYFARKYDPNAVLYCNDYNEEFPTKREAIANMVEETNAQWQKHAEYDGRLLIEGIGMQAHCNENTNYGWVRESIERFIKTGARLAVTELDITFGSMENPAVPLSPEQEKRQIEMYELLFNMYIEFSAYIDRVTMWAKSDGQSWRRWGSPVFFNADGSAKEVFHRVIALANKG